MRGFVSALLFFSAATGVSSFTVNTNTPNLRIKENAGVDMSCSYSADFGSDARLEWKFKDKKHSQILVVFDGQLTEAYKSRATLYGGSNLRFTKVTREDTGEYTCEVSSSKSQFAEATVQLTVLVPPSVPLCKIPHSVTTGKSTMLTCFDGDASPPPVYKWYKDGTLLPDDPSKMPQFKNATYKLDPKTGNLEFKSANTMDTGEYYCEAVNDAGPSQRCKAVRMEIRNVNTGGIVAGVIIALLLVALLIFGVWYAKKKGYLPRNKPRSTAVYQPPSSYAGDEEDDGDFKQKSSFVV
ncbi:unnamed protein product [Menidia menidia]|uniref:Junctional adhesion molecule A n=1 Tax=Menidia menidia TaxID=238744 RepID=A0A8S4ARQ9_9TELE|nr:unnamed protein product [Menidia menidia]